MRVLIIAGPNGAGKTTFAYEFLPAEADCVEFVNADNIAAGLSPFQPESVAWEAGRLMLQRIGLLTQRGVSFALETTLSTRGYLKHIPRWQALGFQVELHFLKLPDADWAVRRVAERVCFGGHHIPEPTIRRRFVRGWKNFEHYKKVVDTWTLYDSAVMPPLQLESSSPALPPSLHEACPAYGMKQPSRRHSDSEPLQPTTGGLAALTRAAEKAIARARAAGLEPIVRFAEKDEQ